MDPVLAQLTQGLTPRKIALTLALGSSIALFPILGTATIACLIAGSLLRLNQPVIQAVNWACTPIHLPFMYFSFVWGNRLLGDPDTALRLRPMLRLLNDEPLRFLTTYGSVALYAIAIWAVLIPFWAAAVYFVSLPILNRAQRARQVE